MRAFFPHHCGSGGSSGGEDDNGALEEGEADCAASLERVNFMLLNRFAPAGRLWEELVAGRGSAPRNSAVADGDGGGDGAPWAPPERLLRDVLLGANSDVGRLVWCGGGEGKGASSGGERRSKALGKPSS